MKWRTRKAGAKIRALHRWHTWFSWYPVRVPTYGKMSGMHRIWLEKVYRKGKYYSCMGDGYWEWEYKFYKK